MGTKTSDHGMQTGTWPAAVGGGPAHHCIISGLNGFMVYCQWQRSEAIELLERQQPLPCG